MAFLPLFHNLSGKCCLVVGGGETAWRKMQLLQRAGAMITVIAPDFLPIVYDTVSSAGGRCLSCDFTDEDLLAELVADAMSSCVLVVSATQDEETDVLVSALAQMHNMPVNVVDKPELCTFIFPSIVDRGDLTVAVSTGGNAPVMARLLRAKLETLLPPHLAKMVSVAGNIRDQLREIFPEVVQRKQFWDALLQDAMIGTTGKGSEALTEEMVLEAARHFLGNPPGGVVDTLLFDSPEPDHMRFFQLRLLQAADVILHDDRVPEALLDLSRRDAERICTGSLSISSVADKHCAEGLRVVIVHFNANGSH